GRLLVLDKRKSDRRINFWLCRCDCSREVWVRATGLQQGSSKSCGCLSRELSAQRARLLKRYRVFLTDEDRRRLEAVNDGDAQIVLLADESKSGPGLTDGQIAQRLGITR